MKKAIFTLAVFACIGLSTNAQTTSRPTFSKKVIDEMTPTETLQLISTGESDSTDYYAFEHMKTLFAEFMRMNVDRDSYSTMISFPEDLQSFQQLITMPCRDKFKDVVSGLFLRNEGWHYVYDICIFDSIVMSYCKSDTLFAKTIALGYINKINCTTQCFICSMNMHYLAVFLTDKSFADVSIRYQDFIKERLSVSRFAELNKLGWTNIDSKVLEVFLTKKLTNKEVIKLIEIYPSEAEQIMASRQK